MDEDNFAPYDVENDEVYLNEIQRTRYLRDCLLLLRASELNQYSLHKHEVALQEISTLVNAKPYDLSDLAGPLIRQLLFMEHKFNLDSFDENNWKRLCVVAVNDPRTTVNFLIEECFRDISIGTRFDILPIIIYSSTYLNGSISSVISHLIHTPMSSLILKPTVEIFLVQVTWLIIVVAVISPTVAIIITVDVAIIVTVTVTVIVPPVDVYCSRFQRLLLSLL